MANTSDFLSNSTAYDILCEAYSAEVCLHEIAQRHAVATSSLALRQTIEAYASTKTRRISDLTCAFVEAKLPIRHASTCLEDGLRLDLHARLEAHTTVDEDLDVIRLIKAFEGVQTVRYSMLRTLAKQCGWLELEDGFEEIALWSLEETDAMWHEADRWADMALRNDPLVAALCDIAA